MAFVETRAGRRANARTSAEARDFLASNRDGWGVVSPRSGGGLDGERCGITAHRGVLHPGEYVNEPRLRALVEQRLGFTFDELRSVYRQGRLSTHGRELRGRIDARLLEIAEAGGNIAQLGRVVGLSVNASGSCQALTNALARARAT